MALIQTDSIAGISVTGLDSLPLSGFTKATPFTCSVSAAPGFNEASITQTYYLIWWFGDGTYKLGYNVQHTYDWPGIYEIKLGAFNFNNSVISVSGSTSSDTLSSLLVRVIGTDFNLIGPGIQQLTFSTVVTAGNYLTDNLTWNYTMWPDLSAGQPANYGAIWHGYQSCKSGTVSGAIPLAFDFSTTNTVLSTVKLDFYSQNSSSQPATEVLPSQYSRLRPQWRFTTVPSKDTDDGDIFVEYTPLSSTEIRILSSGLRSSTGTLVGHSGTVYFYYIDDIPSYFTSQSVSYLNSSYVYSPSAGLNVPTLWVTLNTSDIHNPQLKEYGNIPSYSNSSVLLSSLYYVQALTPDHLSFTLDGYLPFYDIYWPSVESKFILTVNSPTYTDTRAYLSNKPLLQVPYVGLVDPIYNTGNTVNIALSSNTTRSASAYGSFNGNAISLSSNYLSVNFSRFNDASNYIGGWYEGTFTPYTIGTTQLSAITPPAGIYYIVDPGVTPASGYNPYTMPLTGAVITNKAISGTSDPFEVASYNNTYFTRKFNAGFDYGTILKSYALQPTINENSVFFDNYLTAVAGTSASTNETFGGVLYEKIANFASNVVDPYTSNVDQFYSLADSMQVEYDDFNYKAPPALKSFYDLLSIPQSKLWGTRSLYNRDFSLSAHTNLGRSLTAYNIDTAMVSAGQKIVVNDLFNPSYFELIEVPTITSYSSVTARNLQRLLPTTAYPIFRYPLTYYPLSALFGWGLNAPVKGNYNFYVYDSTPNTTQVEGVINWDDEYTTLSENLSSHADWVKDEGYLETIINYNIHKGLGFIK